MIKLSSQQKWTLLVLCLFAAFGGLTMRSALAAWKEKSGLMMMNDARLEGLVHAPDFPKDMEWLNTEKPLALSELRGKLVLLDFWTFCCINCMHVIPDLKRLEVKYPNDLVVIGVHSAKFSNERQSESIREAILRYGIQHPVVNDHELKIWSLYDVSSWPTLVLINPLGKIVGVHSGEGAFEVLDPAIQKTRDYFSKKGELKSAPFLNKKETADTGRLAFPGKISADDANHRLIISDSNHHQILITKPSGEVLERIGSGKMGAEDGSFESASFHGPQGTFLDGNQLYIADTENHLVRRADLKSRTVTTLLGTGEQSHDFRPRGSGRNVGLNSPWDLLVHEGKLFMAMAGAHQIWVADLKTLEVRVFAGSGREARVDGSSHQAALAQPSGITTDGKKLYVADSEVSSVRAIDLDEKGEVRTLIGEDLFVFGDQDGGQATARLQHPLGVAFDQGKIYVADTYNSKIKILDPEKKSLTTFAGSGKHGQADGPKEQAEFFEPAGLAVFKDKVYVADTNNHLIRVLDLKSGGVTTLKITFDQESPSQKIVESKPETVLPSQNCLEGKVELMLNFELPHDYEFTEGAPFEVSWSSDSPALEVVGTPSWSGEVLKATIPIALKTKEGSGNLRIQGQVYFCRESSKICLTRTLSEVIPFQVVASSAASQINIHIPIQVQKTKKNKLEISSEK